MVGAWPELLDLNTRKHPTKAHPAVPVRPTCCVARPMLRVDPNSVHSNTPSGAAGVFRGEHGDFCQSQPPDQNSHAKLSDVHSEASKLVLIFGG